MTALSTLLARTQLSRDIGDLFESAATSTGSTTQFTDSKLADYDDDMFVNKFQTWYKQITGTDAGDSHRITLKVAGLVTHIVATTGIASGNSYEIHRAATPDEKDAAIVHALNELNGTILFKRAFSDVTIVADQFDYNVPSGFYRDQIRQIHIVSNADTEITREIFDWQPRVDSGGANDIHFFSRLRTGATVRMWGHQVVAITDLVDGEGPALMLAAYAEVYLFETLMASVPNDLIARYQILLTQANARYVSRLARFREIGIPFTLTSESHPSAGRGYDFGVA